MRILVTGGAGFIGSHLVDRLVEDGHVVSVVDNLASGSLENLNRDATFYNIDVVTRDLDQVFRSEQPDAVCHLAAQIDVRHSLDNPFYDTNVNVLGTVNVLEGCRRHGVKAFVFSSSGGAIYGDPDYLPADELHPARPVAPYGLAKSVGEQYAELYGRMCGLRCVNLRYGNVYGPRQDPNGEAGVVAIFIGRLLQGEQPVIYGDGEQVRDYIYVEDIVKANILALQTPVSGSYNIGTGVGTSVNSLFAVIATAFDVDMFPDYQPARLGELNQVFLDCKKANEEFGWSPGTDLVDGINLTIDNWRKAEKLVV